MKPAQFFLVQTSRMFGRYTRASGYHGRTLIPTDSGAVIRDSMVTTRGRLACFGHPGFDGKLTVMSRISLRRQKRLVGC